MLHSDDIAAGNLVTVLTGPMRRAQSMFGMSSEQEIEDRELCGKPLRVLVVERPYLLVEHCFRHGPFTIDLRQLTLMRVSRKYAAGFGPKKAKKRKGEVTPAAPVSQSLFSDAIAKYGAPSVSSMMPLFNSFSIKDLAAMDLQKSSGPCQCPTCRRERGEL